MTEQWRPKLTEVKLSDLGVELVDCPVCGGKKTHGMECYDERMCKAIRATEVARAKAVS
jgi:hypothetical protein